MKYVFKKGSQILISLVIFLFLSFYVWAIQLNYDAASVGFVQGLLFSSAILLGGISYDVGKYIVFLELERFWKFFGHLGRGTFWFLATIVTAVIIQLLFEAGLYELISFVLFAFLLSMVHFIKQFENALDTALKNDLLREEADQKLVQNAT